jgi:crotonobetainyl-CoA:carnitine CoA-transferase CaiB-like acyl-CoA transferase
MEQALSDLVVLDLGEGIAAPFCARLLAAYGAEVIKIEPPVRGDSARAYGPFPDDEPDAEKSGLYLYLNTNKRGIALHLTTAAGRDLLLGLAREADVVVESHPPGYLDSLGIGYEALASVNPRIVLTSITGFGQTGPYAAYRSTEIVTAAMSGQLYIQGDPGREPLNAGGTPFAYAAGVHGVLGTMTALWTRDAIGRGQHVDVSAQEVAAHILQQSVSWYAYLGVVQTRIGNRMPFGHPFTILPCKDGYVAVTVLPQWVDSIGLLIGMPELAQDPRFLTPQDCIEHADAMDELMMRWTMQHTRREIVEQAQALRMAFDYVYTAGEMLEDPQFQHRRHFVTIDHPGTGAITFPGAPFAMNGSPVEFVRAPRLGEHTGAVLAERLGLGEAEITRLRDQGVIA